MVVQAAIVAMKKLLFYYPGKVLGEVGYRTYLIGHLMTKLGLRIGKFGVRWRLHWDRYMFQQQIKELP